MVDWTDPREAGPHVRTASLLTNNLHLWLVDNPDATARDLFVHRRPLVAVVHGAQAMLRLHRPNPAGNCTACATNDRVTLFPCSTQRVHARQVAMAYDLAPIGDLVGEMITTGVMGSLRTPSTRGEFTDGESQ